MLDESRSVEVLKFITKSNILPNIIILYDQQIEKFHAKRDVDGFKITLRNNLNPSALRICWKIVWQSRPLPEYKVQKW